MHVAITYPEEKAEAEILKLSRKETKTTTLPKSPITISQKEIFDIRRSLSDIHVSDPVETYITQLIITTRDFGCYGADYASWLDFGASPRGTIALDKCARAKAWLDGRDFITPEDVQAVLHDVLRHRIIRSFEAEADGISCDQIIDTLINHVPVP